MEFLTAVVAGGLLLCLPVAIPLLVFPMGLMEILQWPMFCLNMKNRRVFITGCDSGFGNALAEKLYHQGAIVYAACHSPAGCLQLEKRCPNKEKMKTLVLDIADPGSVQSARDYMFKEVEHTPDGLWAVVNNAGILKGFFVEFTTAQAYYENLEANFLGHVRVTQAMLPLLRKGTGGRVINVSSAFGRFSCPGMSAYCASKYAMEAFSDSLRREICSFGIKVVTVEPWYSSTDMTKNIESHVTAGYREAPAELKEAYGGDRWFNKAIRITSMFPMLRESPKRTVAAMMSAMSSRRPRARYAAGIGTQLFAVPFSWFSGEVQDIVFWFLSKLR